MPEEVTVVRTLSLGHPAMGCKRLAQSNGSLDLDEDVSFGTSEDDDFVRSRIENLLQFRVRAQKLWENPVVKRLLR